MGNEKSCYSIIPAPGAEARKCGGLRHFRRTPSAPGFSKEQSKGYGLAPANSYPATGYPYTQVTALKR